MKAPRPAHPDWAVLPLGDHALAECPRWDADQQRLSWVDILGGVVKTARWLEGRWTHIESRPLGRMPTAAQPLAGGALAVAVDGTVCVMRPDETTTQQVVVSPNFPAVRTNDMTVDGAGRLLVGLFCEDRVSARGGVVAVDLLQSSVSSLARGYVTTNGLAVSADGEHLYAVDTARGTLTRHRLAFAGKAGTVLARHDGPGLLDGIALGPDGDIWAAVWGAGVLHRYAPTGQLRHVIAVPVPRPSALALVPLEGTTHLVVTTARTNLAEPARDTLLKPSAEGCLYSTPLPD